MSVGTELLNEIERVSAKHERWKGYQREMGPSGIALEIGMALMKDAIESAKTSIQSDDPASAIAALQSLRNFDSDD